MNCDVTPELKAPNLDRLAATELRLENFFVLHPHVLWRGHQS